MTNVKLSKEGPIHDVQWSPKGDEFVAVFGYSPSKAVIFNTKCEEVYNFGEAPRNTVRRAHGPPPTHATAATAAPVLVLCLCLTAASSSAPLRCGGLRTRGS